MAYARTSEEIVAHTEFVNELINHRLTWFGTLQGLMFTALSFAWGKTDAKVLEIVICLLGSAVAVSIGVSTLGANQVLEELEKRSREIQIEDATKELSKINLDNLVGKNRNQWWTLDKLAWKNRGPWWWWLMPGYFLPWTFFLAWLVILVTKA
jgi:hypothetical protein